VWYNNHESNGRGKIAPHLLEEVYNLEDALVVAGFLNSFIRHADVVKIANLAQIVNVIAPILTIDDRLLVQSIYHPFRMMSCRRNGIAMRIAVDGPTYEGASNGRVYTVDASAILDNDTLQVFLTNRSGNSDADVDINVADRPIEDAISGEILTGPDPKAANTLEQPDLVAARAFDGVTIANGTATCRLPPLSFAALSFRLG
jgi:alpha-N-arabinofuranosidase